MQDKAKKTRAYLALGSNMGDREDYLRRAIEMMDAYDGIKVVDVSNFYNTAPVGYTQQPDFLNGAVTVDTIFSPHELLKACLDVENQMGRVRTIRWGPRVIDIDILLYDRVVINDSDLIIPHPRMHERFFVLRPLCDIAPDAVHPIYNVTVKELYRRLLQNK